MKPKPEIDEAAKQICKDVAISFLKKEIDRLEAENAALRRGHQMKDNDNAHYEEKWEAEVKRLRETLEWVWTIVANVDAARRFGDELHGKSQEPTP